MERIRKTGIKKEEGNTPDDDGQGGSKPVGGSKKYTSPLTEGTPAPSASDKPILKERKEITVPERKAAGESTYKVGQEEKGRSIFACGQGDFYNGRSCHIAPRNLPAFAVLEEQRKSV